MVILSMLLASQAVSFVMAVWIGRAFQELRR